jgi:acetone carboxylase gamma subunit
MLVREDIRHYGLDPELIESRITPPPAGVSLREWFAPGSAASQLIEKPSPGVPVVHDAAAVAA